MPSEAGAFEAFYASSLQHPILLWLAAGSALAVCMFRRGLHPSARHYCGVLGVLSLADAWLTSSEIFGLGSLSGWSATAIPLFFVLAGDCRYLLFVLAAKADGRVVPNARHFGVAVALTAIVPILSQSVATLVPGADDNGRVLFLIYEVAFACLTLTILRKNANARSNPWIRSVSRFVILYYSLWASADAIILTTGSDLGYLLRVVPNLLYYGGLVAVIGWTAPRQPAGSGAPD